MPFESKYVLFVSMDVTPEKEDLFNEVYDTEHVPALLAVPGVLAVTRLIKTPLVLSMGGQNQEMAAAGEPFHAAVYEIESPDVLISPAWAEAVEAGRWGAEVRPFTSNRHHVLRKVSVAA